MEESADKQPSKRPRGRPRKVPGEPSRHATAAEIEQRRAASKNALAARWGNRGESRQISVDPDAAAALSTVPERDRRRVASEAIRAAVAAYNRA